MRTVAGCLCTVGLFPTPEGSRGAGARLRHGAPPVAPASPRNGWRALYHGAPRPHGGSRGYPSMTKMGSGVFSGGGRSGRRDPESRPARVRFGRGSALSPRISGRFTG